VIVMVESTRIVRLIIHAECRWMLETLSDSLAEQPGLRIVDMTETEAELTTACTRHRPDLVLVDVNALVASIDLFRRLRAAFPSTELMAVASAELTPDALSAVVELNVPALASSPDALDAVLTVPGGNGAGGTADQFEPPRLTHREMTIIDLMSVGHSGPEIARELDLRPRTVENHRRHIYAKLAVGSQSHAISRAISLGLLDTPLPGRQVEPGRAPLVVVPGPPGGARDRVVQALIAAGLPLTQMLVRAPSAHDHWLRWHRGPLIVVLVDPKPEDWASATSMGAVTVVVSSAPPDESAVVAALSHRAVGLVSFEDVATDLAMILGVVSLGHFAMSGAYARTLANSMAAGPPAAPELTARESDILSSIALGHTIRQTARMLGIASKTVENTQARLFRKLGARNRMDALRIADRWGLVDRSTAGSAPIADSDDPDAPPPGVFRP
jgi:DNA-binding NarL/FixJ family response regulator